MKKATYYCRCCGKGMKKYQQRLCRDGYFCEEKKRVPKKKRAVIQGIIRIQPGGDFLEVSRTKTTVGMLALGAVLNTHGWKNKKVRITISEVR
jgi:hypothetical protein